VKKISGDSKAAAVLQERQQRRKKAKPEKLTLSPAPPTTPVKAETTTTPIKTVKAKLDFNMDETKPNPDATTDDKDLDTTIEVTDDSENSTPPASQNKT